MAYHSYNVFSLPQHLIDTLTPRTLVSQPAIAPAQAQASSRTPHPVQSHSNGARACTICPAATFLDVEEQRVHFRSDWHRYNVKLRLTSPNATPVGEEEFSKLVDALEDSISGSESSDDDEEESDEDAVSALMKKTALERLPEEDDADAEKKIPQTALMWFHSPPSTQVGIYKVLFPLSFLAPHFPLSPDAPGRFLEELKRMQQPVEGGRTWALFMVAGGHFAGAVARVSKDGEDNEEGIGKKKQKKPKPETEIILHKTFHRYTTRRKQGGSQGLNDNAKGNAKSAGAQLRRYGELSLQSDIRTLLSDWAEDLEGCERIFIRASGANRRIFLGDYEGSVLTKKDERLRGFPFPTRRPTQGELARCLGELARVKTGNLTEDALRAQDEAYLASLPKPKPKPTPAVVPVPVQRVEEPKLTKEEEAVRDRWGRLLEMVTKGRLEPLRSFWAREQDQFAGGVDAKIPDWAVESHKTSTLLQTAALNGHEDVTAWLLDELHADPTIPVPIPSSKSAAPAPVPEENDEEEDESTALPLAPNARRTAYDLAHTRAIRNIFRRAAYDRPTQWDWLGAARVPSALSREMEARAEEKKKGRRKGLKERVREREARDKERERERERDIVPETPKKVVERDIHDTGPRRLGGSSGGQEGTTGLTPEMRIKVERERRARAVEARMKALSGK
ncbi:hypothetical protein HWV62_14740 [Athelia sp. TMB]|nr:hypothetical protein HWV62_14740 [Athelia sp. TMB]